MTGEPSDSRSDDRERETDSRKPHGDEPDGDTLDNAPPDGVADAGEFEFSISERVDLNSETDRYSNSETDRYSNSETDHRSTSVKGRDLAESEDADERYGPEPAATPIDPGSPSLENALFVLLGALATIAILLRLVTIVG